MRHPEARGAGAARARHDPGAEEPGGAARARNVAAADATLFRVAAVVAGPHGHRLLFLGERLHVPATRAGLDRTCTLRPRRRRDASPRNVHVAAAASPRLPRGLSASQPRRRRGNIRATGWVPRRRRAGRAALGVRGALLLRERAGRDGPGVADGRAHGRHTPRSALAERHRSRCCGLRVTTSPARRRCKKSSKGGSSPLRARSRAQVQAALLSRIAAFERVRDDYHPDPLVSPSSARRVAADRKPLPRIPLARLQGLADEVCVIHGAWEVRLGDAFQDMDARCPSRLSFFCVVHRDPDLRRALVRAFPLVRSRREPKPCPRTIHVAAAAAPRAGGVGAPAGHFRWSTPFETTPPAVQPPAVQRCKNYGKRPLSLRR